MFSQTTRLELFIVAAALLVLLWWNRAPRSGNAEVRLDAGQITQETQPQSGSPQSAVAFSSSSSPSLSDIPMPAGAATISEPDAPALAVPTQPKFRRIGVVDARNCSELNYKDVLYGEVTDRWIWDGQKFILHKVCVVKESSGVTTVWDFDEHDPNVKLSEIQEPLESH